MAYRGIIDRPPSFGEQFGRGLGAGVSSGVSSGLEKLLKDLQQKRDVQLFQKISQSQGYDSTSKPDQIELQEQKPLQRSQDLYQKAAVLSSLGKKEFADILLKQASNLQKQESAKEKLEFQTKKEIKPTIQNILKGYESAQVSKANLDRMEELEKEDLTGPFTVKLSNTLGIPISVLANPESEEFEKLVSQRGLNVAQAYGMGRILQTEYENFLRTIPTLLNSKEGRKRIYQTLRYTDDLAIKRYEILKDLKKTYKGKYPLDIDEIVTEKMEPEFQKFGEILKQGSGIRGQESKEKSLESIFGF